MVMDYNALLEYTRAKGDKDWAVTLKEFPGIQGMAFTELKLDELESYGICTVYSGIALGADTGQGSSENPPLPNPGYTYLVQWSPHREVTPEKLVEAVNQAFPKANAHLWDSSKSHKIAGARVVEIEMPLRSLQTTGLCYPDWAIAKAQEQKLRIWLRPENKASTIAPGDIQGYFGRLAGHKPEGIIFGGSSNEVVGYSDEDVLKSTAAAIRDQKWKLGFIESAKANQQKGIETLVRNSELNTVRVFTVPPMQQEKLKPERVAQMYSLAARERNLTLLYLRPYAYDPTPDKGFEDANTKFFTDLSHQLEDRLGNDADTFHNEVELNRGVVALLSLAGLAAFWLVVLEYFPKVAPAPIAASLIVFALLNAGLANKHAWMALMALGTACCLSALSVISQFQRLRRAADKPTDLEALKSSSLAWLIMSLISLAGAWIASCFLQETTYKLGLDIFRGVKVITVLMPVAITALWCLSEDQRKHWLGIGGAPLKLYQLIALGILAVGGLVYTMRTGNMAGTDVGDSMEQERYLRMVLDKTLGVRPRFKEFLMAHPAMLLAPVALRLGWKELTAILILVGATGQCGLFDTFAHVHTPLQVSLIRCVMGAAFGLLFGWIYAGILLAAAKGLGWLQKKVVP
ncbi:hypothetical protein ABS71_13980 [bacterium SCN 62-11]|nr:MAG: hypothetical protein ABS71_13980 [bacterium SCN 62-11]